MSFPATLNVANEYERQQVEAIMQQKTVRDYMTVYNKLVEKCFSDCVNSFSSRKLTGKETSCVNTCCDKFLMGVSRMNQRFVEQNILMQEKKAEALKAARSGDDSE
ncbi:uncharacterized protein AMSG_04670 [Thecamonas trahens ATCC 50062]|uniref:Mitochondrial import inner membrane translocase subunit n=1 Tax=Thecamonas trahens ATCC 50062 TaxID=461836 RepID=A0A0L0D9K6_THETB|nr:hypothetical protein AMSG_04670 [Thecamonas trahens ATCC 50062]KNC48925.1 hypothetical protein AMSG_04670 [Thecamonas trahens ATCC 50062]|eukprot:XP_013758342.1 hypothetical protein AMSG_04670 [Thecamonas trahens ATCC 50062]